MTTYRTLDRRVLDLSGLTPEEQAYFEGCVAAYRAGTDWAAFSELAEGRGNPLVRAADGWVTRAVWEHPLFQATTDLADRLGIAQGEMAPGPGDDLTTDPLGAHMTASVPPSSR